MTLSLYYAYVLTRTSRFPEPVRDVRTRRLGTFIAGYSGSAVTTDGIFPV